MIQPEITGLRKSLMRKGYSPIPVEGKRPVLQAWEKKTQTNDEEIALWATTYDRAQNTGALTRLMPTLDIDIKNEEAAKAVEDLAREKLEERGYVLVRIGEPPKRAIPMRTSEPFKKIISNVTAPNGASEKIELLCDGQQVVVFGIHPNTQKPYAWHGGTPNEIGLDDLPYISHDDAEALVIEATELLVRDFSYIAADARPKAGGNGHAETQSDWAWLIKNILNNHEVHDSSTTLAAKLLAAGMTDGAAVNCLRGLFESYSGVHDSHWQERFDDLSRAVASARKKFDPQQPPQQRQAKPSLPLPPIMSKREFVKGFVPPHYLIDVILQLGFLYAMTGQTGHAKTAVALLIAQLVSSKNPQPLGRHNVERGRVVYFVGENPDDVRMRIIGTDSMRSDLSLEDNISFIPGIFNVEQMLPVLAEDAKQHGEISLIIIDTSAAYFLGDEEMSNTQMATHARMLRRLTTLPGHPCTLALCHPIKHATDASQLLPRGGGAFLAEIDGNLTLWRQDDLAILDHSGKFRGPGFQPITFRLERIEHAEGLIDSKGRPIGTVHAVPITSTEEDAAQKSARSKEDHVLTAMLKLQGEEGSMAKWAEHLGWTNAKGEADKKAVENAIQRLKHAKPALIQKNRDKWELTEAGKDAARKAAIKFQAQQDAAAQKDMSF